MKFSRDTMAARRDCWIKLFAAQLTLLDHWDLHWLEQWIQRSSMISYDSFIVHSQTYFNTSRVRFVSRNERELNDNWWWHLNHLFLLYAEWENKIHNTDLRNGSGSRLKVCLWPLKSIDCAKMIFSGTSMPEKCLQIMTKLLKITRGQILNNSTFARRISVGSSLVHSLVYSNAFLHV